MPAIKVSSVFEQYVHQLVTPCPHCGQGPLVAEHVQLLEAGVAIIDRVRVICRSCNQPSTFDYEVTDYQQFAGTLQSGGFCDAPASTAVDLDGWLSVAALLADLAESTQDPAAARLYGLDATACLSEALKFFEDGQEHPHESAIWTDVGVEHYESCPEGYTRSAILEMKQRLPSPTVGELAASGRTIGNTSQQPASRPAAADPAAPAARHRPAAPTSAAGYAPDADSDPDPAADAGATGATDPEPPAPEKKKRFGLFR